MCAMKSVLWLIHQKQVCISDLSELSMLGFNIYPIKSRTWAERKEGDECASQGLIFDSLDISIKKELEEADFTKGLPPALWETINQQFGFVFLDYYVDQFVDIVDHFKGIIVFRPTSSPVCKTWSDQLMQDCGTGVFKKIDLLGYRFWFAPIHYGLVEKEAIILKRRSVYLPLSLRGFLDEPNRTYDRRIIVACPEIKVNPRQEAVYKEILSSLKDLKGKYPVSVYGKQYLDSQYDNRIVGDVSESTIDDALQHGACLIIPTAGAGDIEYFYLKGLVASIPVLLFGDNGGDWVKFALEDELKLSSGGICKSVQSLITKLGYLLKGDNSFRKNLLSQQQALFSAWFDSQKNSELFKLNMLMIQSQSEFKTHLIREKSHIGIIMSDNFSQAAVLYAQEIARTLSIETDLRLSVGVPKEWDFEQLLKVNSFEEMGIPIRYYRLEEKSQQWVDDAMDMKGYPRIGIEAPVYVLNDGSTFFEDCDLLLFIINPRINTSLDLKKIISSVPYCVFVTDADTEHGDAHGFYGAIFQRAADRIIVPDERTRDRIIYTEGVSRNKVSTIPISLSLNKELKPNNSGNENRWLLLINGSNNESFSLAERTIAEYFARGGMSSVLLARQTAESYQLLHISSDDYRDYIQTNCRDEVINSLFVKMQATASVSLTAFLKQIEKVRFMVVPELLDMRVPLIELMIENNKMVICLETARSMSLADISKQNIVFLTEKSGDYIVPAVFQLENELSNIAHVSAPTESERINNRQIVDMLRQSFTNLINWTNF